LLLECSVRSEHAVFTSRKRSKGKTHSTINNI